MALELNGTTGVSLVQDGVVTAADLASTLDLTGKTVTLPAGVGGKVLQIVESSMAGDSGTSVSTSTTYFQVGLSATITPTAANNKILVLVDYLPRGLAPIGNDMQHYYQIYVSGIGAISGSEKRVLWDNLGKLGDTVFATMPLQWMVQYTAPSTAALTFNVEARCAASTMNLYYRFGNSRIQLLEIAA